MVGTLSDTVYDKYHRILCTEYSIVYTVNTRVLCCIIWCTYCTAVYRVQQCAYVLCTVFISLLLQKKKPILKIQSSCRLLYAYSTLGVYSAVQQQSNIIRGILYSVLYVYSIIRTVVHTHTQKHDMPHTQKHDATRQQRAAPQPGGTDETAGAARRGERQAQSEVRPCRNL